MKVYEQRIIKATEYDFVVKKLREFFSTRNYLECHPQCNVSIMAACEDPDTVRSYVFNGEIWPLPQTGQMWLEYHILAYPELDGVFCITTSFRDEPNPIEGRHDKIFPMFEFEHIGTLQDLIYTLSELSVHLGLVNHIDDIPIFTYNELCKKYDTEYLHSEHETLIWNDFGDVVGIIDFPERTSPFFNMQEKILDVPYGERLFHKCDFIICGIETFGSAARSNDVNQMMNSFYSISDGNYSRKLYNEFQKERTIQELHDYLRLPMRDRFGAGIGITRLIRALKLKNIL